MNFCRICFSVWLVFAGLRLPAAPVAAALPDLRLHWLGMQSTSADTNAVQFMKVWQLPETVALVNQTLDQLSRWPGGGATNTASQSLRPLMDDLIATEFYVEVFTPTNSQLSTFNHQLLLALRLPSARAGLWQTNLATAFTALTGQKPVATKIGWSLSQAGHYGQAELIRSGDWTIFGVGPQVHDVLPEFASSLSPATRHRSHSDNWLETEINVASLAARYHDERDASSKLKTQNSKRNAFYLLSTFNRVQLTVSGRNGQVMTAGTFTLAQPCKSPLPEWIIPTNLIHGDLTGFTAMRGMNSWLLGLPVWQKTGLAPAPDQAFIWALDGVPFKTYFLAPMPGASNELVRLSNRLIGQGNRWLATNGLGSFQWKAGQSALVWSGALILNPFLAATAVNGTDCLMGCLYPINLAGPPLPADIEHELARTPDLVYYQTEQTANRVDAELFIWQLFRVVFHKPQLPATEPATIWLKQIQPLLGTCETTIRRTTQQTLTLQRQSTIGLSAFELHLLTDWLESPQFPRGLHTFLIPSDQP